MASSMITTRSRMNSFLGFGLSTLSSKYRDVCWVCHLRQESLVECCTLSGQVFLYYFFQVRQIRTIGRVHHSSYFVYVPLLLLLFPSSCLRVWWNDITGACNDDVAVWQYSLSFWLKILFLDLVSRELFLTFISFPWVSLRAKILASFSFICSIVWSYNIPDLSLIPYTFVHRFVWIQGLRIPHWVHKNLPSARFP